MMIISPWISGFRVSLFFYMPLTVFAFMLMFYSFGMVNNDTLDFSENIKQLDFPYLI